MSLPQCEKDIEQLFAEWIAEYTDSMDRMKSRIETISTEIHDMHIMLRSLFETFERFRPLIERYEQASKAQGFRAQRAAMKGPKNG